MDMASLLYGLLALALTFRLARSVSGSGSAALAALTAVTLAQSICITCFYEPSYSHTFTVFVMTLFLVA